MTGRAISLTVRNNDHIMGLKQNTAQEIQLPPIEELNSPPAKRKAPASKPVPLKSSNVFDALITIENKEVCKLFSKYVEVLSERAAADAAQVKELEGILIEARNLESHLKDKKDHLRQTLALISDKLQG